MPSAIWILLLYTAVLLPGYICLNQLQDYWTEIFQSTPRIPPVGRQVPFLNLIFLAMALFSNRIPHVFLYLLVWLYFAAVFYLYTRSSGAKLLLGSLMPTLHLCLLHFVWSVLACALFYPGFDTPVYQVLLDTPNHLYIAALTFLSAWLMLAAFKRQMPAQDIRSFMKDAAQLGYSLHFVVLTYGFLLFDTLISYLVNYCSKANAYLLFSAALSAWLFTLFWIHILRIIKASQYEKAYEDLRKKVSQQDNLERRLESLAFRDHLTGCYTRNYVEYIIAHSDLDTPYAAIYIDLNGLKTVNDSLGHAIGDLYLQQTTQILTACIREEDVLARLGGDEFLILIPYCSRREAEEILTRAVQILGERGTEQNIPMSLSYGIAVREEGDLTPLSELIEQADSRMYLYKQQH